ncbi:MAG: outer membrane protein assembly factor BamD [Deltaproteobacteria bacterium]|nr:outer membrane protein assembly factor BamD [Deltaproteobacteria bacterium]
MSKPTRHLLLVLSLFALTACGKQTFDIGNEAPEVEIKKCTLLSQKKKYEKAVECLEIFKSRFPQTAEGQEAELRIADNYFNQHQFLLAADSYLSFVKLHRTHPDVDYALFRAGLSYFKEAPKAIDRDQQYLIKAVEQLETASKSNPRGIYQEGIVKYLKLARERMALRIFYVGHFYYRTGQYIASIPRFEELVQKYPDSSLVPKSLYNMTKANLKLGRTEEARQAVEFLMEQYPKNRWTTKAQNRYLAAVKK